MNFCHPKLLKRYGSWVGVQVRFYDFLFESALNAQAGCIKTEMMKEWHDGGDPYEKAKASIELAYLNPESAWTAFLKTEKLK